MMKQKKILVIILSATFLIAIAVAFIIYNGQNDLLSKSVKVTNAPDATEIYFWVSNNSLVTSCPNGSDLCLVDLQETKTVPLNSLSAEAPKVMAVVTALKAQDQQFQTFTEWTNWFVHKEGTPPHPVGLAWNGEYRLIDVAERTMPGEIIWLTRSKYESVSERYFGWLLPRANKKPQWVDTLWVSGYNNPTLHKIGSIYASPANAHKLSGLRWRPDGKEASFVCDGSIWTVQMHSN